MLCCSNSSAEMLTCSMSIRHASSQSAAGCGVQPLQQQRGCCSADWQWDHWASIGQELT